MSNENKHLKGYHYFIHALDILKHDRTLPMMRVYEIIADIYNVTPDSVRFAISRYIRKFDRRKPYEVIAQYSERF